MMEYTDVFTSEDDALSRARNQNLTNNYSYVCPPSSCQKKCPSPVKSILRNANDNSIMSAGVDKFNDPIMTAVLANDITSLKSCLNRTGAVLNTDMDGRTALHIAVEHGLQEVAKVLLQCFPMYNVNTPDKSGSTCLHKSASIGHVEIIQNLLERGAQVNVQDSTHGNTPLHEASWKGYSRSVELLCTVGRLPNLVNYALFTPLHLAVQGGHNQTTRNLIRSGADLSAQNRFGDTPLHTAVRYGHAGVSRILATVCSNTTCNTNMSMVTPLLDTQNQNGDSPLHIAAALKRRKIARLLVDVGANRNVINCQGQTPLDVATRKNHPELVEILQVHRVSVPANEKGGTLTKTQFEPQLATPIHYSTSRLAHIPNPITQQTNPIQNAPNTEPQSKSKDSSSKSKGIKGWWQQRKKRSKSKSKKKDDDNITDAPVQQPTGDSTVHYFTDLSPASCSCPIKAGNLQNVCVDHGYLDYHGPMTSINRPVYQPPPQPLQQRSQLFQSARNSQKNTVINLSHTNPHPSYVHSQWSPTTPNIPHQYRRDSNKLDTTITYQPASSNHQGNIKHSNSNLTNSISQLPSPYRIGLYQSGYKSNMMNLGETPEHLLQPQNGGLHKRSRSDESLNQSEHKARMRAERHSKSGHSNNSGDGTVVKGRRQVAFQDTSNMKVIRPSPEGQTSDCMENNQAPSVPTFPHALLRRGVNMRASTGGHNSSKVMLAPSRV